MAYIVPLLGQKREDICSIGAEMPAAELILIK